MNEQRAFADEEIAVTVEVARYSPARQFGFGRMVLDCQSQRYSQSEDEADCDDSRKQGGFQVESNVAHKELKFNEIPEPFRTYRCPRIKLRSDPGGARAFYSSIGVEAGIALCGDADFLRAGSRARVAFGNQRQGFLADDRGPLRAGRHISLRKLHLERT